MSTNTGTNFDPNYPHGTEYEDIGVEDKPGYLTKDSIDLVPYEDMEDY